MSQKRAKVLLVEDNPGDVRLVEEMLTDDHSHPFELLHANRLSEAFLLLKAADKVGITKASVKQGQVAVILLDLKLPDGEGLDTLKRMHIAAPGIPIVVLSAEEDEALAVRSVKLGAQDFLIKGNVSRQLLRRSLSYAIERKQMAEQLHHMAHHDELTGLANRKLFYECLEQAIKIARRANKQSALLFLDLTGFKAINDSLGHHVGDLLLQGVAKRLTDCVRASDCVARLGGDEFTITLGEVHGVENAALIAQKILNVLLEPFMLESQRIQVYASLGIALFPNDGDDAEVLIRAADTAMYQAKTEARNGSNYCFFSPELTVKARGYAETGQRLREAFEQGEFVLHYQPEVDIRSSRIIGMEALLRWQHPEEGLLTPARFMDAMEETGLIVPVGEWILSAACAQSKAWQDEGLPALMVSVNVSPRQFRQDAFVETVANALRQTGLDGSRLELEFTEEVLREDEQRSIMLLDSLSRLGVKLTLDNFGSGVISLKSLMKFPIHAIKIDRSLIQDANQGASGAVIARAAIEVARTFNIKSLAEGVETSGQLDTLRQIACDDAQGYLYSQPLPPSAVTQLIRENHPLHENVRH